jgi:histone H3/H4
MRNKNTSTTRKIVANKEGGKSIIVSKKKHRYHPGTVALREIKKYQSNKLAGKLLLTKEGFGRLVKEITQELMPGSQMQKSAFEALQEASEAFLVDTFKDAVGLQVHAGRSTLMVTDMKLARKMRGSINSNAKEVFSTYGLYK